MPKKGKDVLAIMLGGKPSKGKGRNREEEYQDEEEGYEEGTDYDEAFVEASAEAFEAVKADDSEGFASALKDAIHLCIDDLEE